jgi:hypothetical protein
LSESSWHSVGGSNLYQLLSREGPRVRNVSSGEQPSDLAISISSEATETSLDVLIVK